MGTAFDRTALQQVPYWLHWDGVGWRQGTLPGSPAGQFNGVTALSATKVYAVGSLIARWNGTAWVQETAPGGSLMAADVVGPGTVWTVGMGYDAAWRLGWQGWPPAGRTLWILNRTGLPVRHPSAAAPEV